VPVASEEWSGVVSPALIDRILNVIADELVATGLDVDDEHNERGRQLEDVIDQINRLRWAS
jgi:hypothetical protein